MSKPVDDSVRRFGRASATTSGALTSSFPTEKKQAAEERDQVTIVVAVHIMLVGCFRV